jgi:large subunit ribosomal protein L18
MFKAKRENRIKRHTRVRAKITGTKEIPRVSVFRSNRHLFVQVIDDLTGKTLMSNSIESKAKKTAKTKAAKSENATKIGEMIAEKAKAAGISKIMFDRGGYKYHGRVKALADGLRKGGLEF